jgi:hypothetical protein
MYVLIVYNGGKKYMEIYRRAENLGGGYAETVEIWEICLNYRLFSYT